MNTCCFINDVDGGIIVGCPECEEENKIYYSDYPMIAIESNRPAKHHCSKCGYPLYYSIAFSW
jgi:hypothetical protein